jgi:hypothetical protein
MGDKLALAPHRDLYGFWKEQGLAATLFDDAAGAPEDSSTNVSSEVPIVLNVASEEYSKAIDRGGLPPHVWIDCVFWNSGSIVSVYAKEARGLMCRFCALSNAQTREDVIKFDLAGYAFQADESTATKLVFGRPKPPPKTAAPKAKAKAGESSKGAQAAGSVGSGTNSGSASCKGKADLDSSAAASRKRRRKGK